MRKIITIIGIVIIVLAFVAVIFLNSYDVLATKEVSSNQTTGTSGWNLVFDQTQTKEISGFESSLTFYVLLNLNNPTQAQTFTITVGLSFPTGIYPGCNDKAQNLADPCQVTNKTVTLSTSGQTTIQYAERSINIPIFTSGLSLKDSNTNRIYYIMVTSSQPFTFSYLGIAQARIGFFVGIPLLLIGIIVLVVGIVLKESGRIKPMKARSWQEPTLGGNASKGSSTMYSRKAKKSSKGGGGSGVPQSSKVTTSVNCKKCGGVIPRNSQYSPHCYARQ